MTESPTPRRQGFTLVELLVVIAIIGTLAAIAVPMITRARVSANVSKAKYLIQNLTLALSQYEGQFGDYPPTSIEEAYDIRGNGLDSGIESAVLHLSTQKKGGPFIAWEEGLLENYDGDAVGEPALKDEIDWLFGDDQLRECIDPWGVPLIYIHNRDYEDPQAVSEGEDHHRATATAARSESMAIFHLLDTFQLWSCGPNMENENGEGDDIVSWD